MALATVLTRAHAGIDAPCVTVEVHLGAGLPGLAIVGLVETAVRESRERVRAAIAQSGFEMPQRKITVNLAPADLPKRGGRFDLAIAIGLLCASKQVAQAPLAHCELFGELGFNGALRSVRALLPAVLAARDAGHCCIVPQPSQQVVSVVSDGRQYCAPHLTDVVRHLNGEQLLAPLPSFELPPHEPPTQTLDDVQGQHQARYALKVAAAGRHNLLLVGPPGAGKTMLARRLPELLPPLGEREMIESLIVRSVASGATDVSENALTRSPPFRMPHHTSSAAALVGGGNPPLPGEISRAHCGVLFLDELPEFARGSLEALREPMETGTVRIARSRASAVFPARFQLIAAMNPCPCGYAGAAGQECRCTPDQVRHYNARLSGPLLDRMGLGVFLQRESITLSDAPAPTAGGEPVRERCIAARATQMRRAGCANAELRPDGIKRFCWPDRPGRRLLERAAQKHSLSRRACDSALRVARTVAMLEPEE